ncbi:hypothetical protein L195_g032198, partial [Trifolium pratense]
MTHLIFGAAWYLAQTPTAKAISGLLAELDVTNAKVRSLEEQVAMLAQQFALYSKGNE